MLTADRFRLLALELPGAIEGTHHGHADFRVGKKVFASLGWPGPEWAMVKLAPGQQRQFVEEIAEAFIPCPGAWGRRGSTNVRLQGASEAAVRRALQIAWESVIEGGARRPRQA